MVLLACLVLAAGCNFAPKYSKPEVQAPAAFKELAPAQFPSTDGWKSAEPKDDVMRGPWWELFHEPALNGLESQVIVSNQNIAAAVANFLAARAMLKEARSQYYPTVSADPSVTRARESSSPGRSGSSSTTSTFTEYSLPLDASWEPDFWGRIRNTVKANSLEAQATLADLENVRLTVEAEVAQDYFAIGFLDAQRQVLDESVAAYQETLRLIEVQERTGLASGQDVEQAETELEITRAQATDVGIQRALLEHAVATLLGLTASSFSIARLSPVAKPIAIPFGVPSELLERRPDIAAAERRVAEANVQIGVARAAYFPAVTLNGTAGFQSTSLQDLFSGPGLVWSVGASLAQTLFDGGLRRAVTEQARATYEGTVANYRQTVLTAFQGVEDNLANLRILSQERQQQSAAVDSSDRYLQLARDRYESGLDNYVSVAAAEVTLLSNQRTVLNLQAQQLTATVQLIKTLGGGWNVSAETAGAVP